MATTANKRQPKETVEQPNEQAAALEPTEREAALLDEVLKLKEKLAAMEEKKKEDAQTDIVQKPVETPTNEVVYAMAQMDKPCTLIHLLECIPGLETTISVGGRDYSFAAFGEKRTVRFEIMEQIVSKYRDYFRRGIFTLGSDCGDAYEQFGIKVEQPPMSVDQYAKMEMIPLNEFSELINSLSMAQRVQIAHTWTQRYYQNKDNYNDVERIKILNDATDGSLKDFLMNIATA